jgi:mitogen-activated protein kinase kinase kinase
MFHIGVATQHPPLPEPGQLSDLGINFIKQCLTLDPIRRPSAKELLDHPWMQDFRETLSRYEAAETEPPSLGKESSYEDAPVARQAAILHQEEIEMLGRASPETPSDCPSE